jgi:hypothetical protein
VVERRRPRVSRQRLRQWPVDSVVKRQRLWAARQQFCQWPPREAVLVEWHCPRVSRQQLRRWPPSEAVALEEAAGPGPPLPILS